MLSPRTARRSRNLSSARALVRWLPVGAALLALVSCIGERPTLNEPGAATLLGGPLGNAAADGVLERLEGPVAQHTVTYSILTKAGEQGAAIGATEQAVVARDTDRLSVTALNVRFIANADGEQVCELSTNVCSEGFDSRSFPAATALAPDFASLGIAQKLRLAFTRRSSDPVPSTESVLDQEVKCVFIPLGEAVTVEVGEKFCALAQGSVALFDSADLRVEAVELVDSIDETVFETQG